MTCFCYMYRLLVLDVLVDGLCGSLAGAHGLDDGGCAGHGIAVICSAAIRCPVRTSLRVIRSLRRGYPLSLSSAAAFLRVIANSIPIARQLASIDDPP